MNKKKIWLTGIILLIAAISCFAWRHRSRVASEILTIANRASHPQAPSKLSPGTFRDSIPHNSCNRTFIIHVPELYKPENPIPVVLMFHGSGSSGILFEACGMDDVADRKGFIVVYPDAISADRTWSDGRGKNDPVREGIDDVGFVSALIDYLETKANVNPDRIYAAGMSNGAMMCHRLGCELSDKIAAIGAVSGTIMVDRCEPTRPVPIIMVYGTADHVVAWDGSPGVGRDHPSVPYTIDVWKKANGCKGDTKLPYFETGNVHAEYQGDSSYGADVVLCTIEGGGHEWPVSESFNVNEALWDFFEEHLMKK
jgi:polyhydroxybutyrate depolymerase